MNDNVTCLFLMDKLSHECICFMNILQKSIKRIKENDYDFAYMKNQIIKRKVS